MYLKRFFAAYIDIMIVTAFTVVPSIIFHISIPIYSALYLLLFIFKDFFFTSVGKRILKLKVVDISGAEIKRNAKLILRNITFFIVPVEIIFLIVKKNVRIGDIISDTKVVEK